MIERIVCAFLLHSGASAGQPSQDGPQRTIAGPEDVCITGQQLRSGKMLILPGGRGLV